MALAHFQRTFTDASGNVKPGLSVTVRRESDNGLAALFADAGSVTPKSNPFNTDANGYGSFYVVDGRYRIQATDIDWRNEDLISQPSPNFSAMPQVGGDPIVESGSNANGEYTKFADGTLITRVVSTIDFSTAFPVLDKTTAATFSSGNFSINCTRTTSGAFDGELWAPNLLGRFAQDGNTVRLGLDSANTMPGFSADILITCIGRWS